MSEPEDVRSENIIDVKCPQITRSEVLPGWSNRPVSQDVLFEQFFESIDWLLDYLSVDIFEHGDSYEDLSEFLPIETNFMLTFDSSRARGSKDHIEMRLLLVCCSWHELAYKVLLEVD